jgi:broad specificity phosphatase PhoE
MKIALIRHAKVNYDEPLLSTASSFRQSRADYDDGPLVPSSLHVSSDDFPQCFVSVMHRALATAEMVYTGMAIPWPDLVEVENTPFFFPRILFPTVLRKIASRIAWFFNYKKMPETRRQTMARARKVILRILQGKAIDTVLFTHGFFMRCLQHELHKFGFKGSIGLSPRHSEIYVFEMIPEASIPGDELTADTTSN